MNYCLGGVILISTTQALTTTIQSGEGGLVISNLSRWICDHTVTLITGSMDPWTPMAYGQLYPTAELGEKGGGFPRAQQAQGRKTASPKILLLYSETTKAPPIFLKSWVFFTEALQVFPVFFAAFIAFYSTCTDGISLR